MLPLALGLHVVFRERTFAEIVAFQLYVTGQLAMYNAVIVAASALTGSIALMGVQFLGQVILQGWAATGLFERSWKTAVLAAVAVVGAILVSGLVGGAIGILVSLIADTGFFG